MPSTDLPPFDVTVHTVTEEAHGEIRVWDMYCCLEIWVDISSLM